MKPSDIPLVVIPCFHLKFSCLHVVVPSPAEPEVPDVDAVADGWDEWVDGEAEDDHEDKVLPPLLDNEIIHNSSHMEEALILQSISMYIICLLQTDVDILSQTKVLVSIAAQSR